MRARPPGTAYLVGLRKTEMTDTKDPILLLASRSPRRRELLTEALVRHDILDAGIDDGELTQGHVSAKAWVMALAYLKARAGWDNARSQGLLHPGAHVMGADTVCVLDGLVIGQPIDEHHARLTIESFENRPHDVYTGVCVLDHTGAREVFAVGAVVTVGSIGEPRIADYLKTGLWKGKAGSYNYFERLSEGWPLTCEGDPTAVVGLPMQAVLPKLQQRGLVSLAS